MDETPLMMSLETATRAGSVAMTRGERLLSASAGDAGVSHSTHLLHQIQQVLDEAGVRLHAVDFFAVATGPGSFTGLRIGLATVKSFGATLDRRCVGVQTLHAVASEAGESGETVAMLPAGRGEVYVQRFSVAKGGMVRPLDEARHQDPERLLQSLAPVRSLKWAGEGAHLHASEIKARAVSEGIEFRMAESGTVRQRDEGLWILVKSSEVLAVSVARLALEHVRRGDILRPQDLSAIYIRPSDAKLSE